MLLSFPRKRESRPFYLKWGFFKIEKRRKFRNGGFGEKFGGIKWLISG
jgi:hypothetical protein